MRYPMGFFEISLHFARKVAELGALPFDEALLRYTNLYIRFGLGRAFDPTHPVWQAYLRGLRQANDPLAWTYHFYLAQPEVATPPAASFGCFSYARLEDDKIRLHFHNNEFPEYSPLSKARIGLRLAELTALFAHIKRTEAFPSKVIGASWLYHLDAYRRLFPPNYLATVQESRGLFAFMPLWGQFINHRGGMKEDAVHQFLTHLKQQQSLDTLDSCFPYSVLRLSSAIEEFYHFFGIR